MFACTKNGTRNYNARSSLSMFKWLGKALCAVAGHFAERHFAERHFAVRHFAKSHFAERHFAERTICRTVYLPKGHFANRTFWKIIKKQTYCLPQSSSVS